MGAIKNDGLHGNRHHEDSHNRLCLILFYNDSKLFSDTAFESLNEIAKIYHLELKVKTLWLLVLIVFAQSEYSLRGVSHNCNSALTLI